MPLFNIHQLSNNELFNIKMSRWKARTDLGYLCREILGYPDVSQAVHGPILKLLELFPGPNQQQFYESDDLSKGYVKYTPLVSMTKLPGRRRKLILDPRGWLKTTINSQAHTIQWILNYPDIAIQVIQSNLDKAELVLAAIKNQFTKNTTFRALFPEFCPQRKLDDWGTKGMFVTEARSKTSTRAVPTCMIGSIDKQMAGLHFDVMKFSDIVEPSNTNSDDAIAEVIQNYHMMEHLLVAPNYWIYVEGTRYTYNDLYGKIIKDHLKTLPENREWDIHVRGAYKKKLPFGAKEQFLPEELACEDFELSQSGENVLHWFDEERGRTPRHYENMRRKDPYIFSCQVLNNPSVAGLGEATFPVDSKNPKVISEKDFRQNVRIAYYLAAVDTASTVNKRSNYSCITVAAVANDGRHYIVEIVHGKFLPAVLVEKIADVVQRYHYEKSELSARLVRVNLEKTEFVLGLQVALAAWEQKNRKKLFIELVPRDTNISKPTRIQNTLSPPYNDGRIIFLDYLDERDDKNQPTKRAASGEEGTTLLDYVRTELKEFPMGSTDDIIDTLTDLFQNRQWFGREKPREQSAHARAEAVAQEFSRMRQLYWNRALGPEDPTDVTTQPYNNAWL